MNSMEAFIKLKELYKKAIYIATKLIRYDIKLFALSKIKNKDKIMVRNN